ncbi:MAG: MmcQ/YjbR family DNA-binding protein [Acidimicrobiales bacterium]
MTAGRRMEADDLASFALWLPAVEERETWDHPSSRVRNKMFLTLAGDGSTATLKATPSDQTALIADSGPDAYRTAALALQANAREPMLIHRLATAGRRRRRGL